MFCSDCGKKIRRIRLTGGKYSVIHLEDFSLIRRFAWRENGKHTAIITSQRLYGKTVTFSLHRFIFYGTERAIGPMLDHSNRNIYDNRRCNLRPATRSLNNVNSTKRKNASISKYKGVSKQITKRQGRSIWSGKWVAHGCQGGRLIHLGVYETEKGAARAYDIDAKKRYGCFALLNLPKANFTPVKCNTVRKSNNTSGYRGVSIDRGSIVAYIGGPGKRCHLGTFRTLVAAAVAYDQAAKQMYGDSAITNFG
jgi:hypothetical protein